MGRKGFHCLPRPFLSPHRNFMLDLLATFAPSKVTVSQPHLLEPLAYCKQLTLMLNSSLLLSFCTDMWLSPEDHPAELPYFSQLLKTWGPEFSCYPTPRYYQTVPFCLQRRRPSHQAVLPLPLLSPQLPSPDTTPLFS